MNLFKTKAKNYEPYERDKDFKIFQFIKIEALKGNRKKKFKPSVFVSPLFGTTVKDVTVAPYENVETGDKVRQLDFLRKNKKIDPKKYHEFEHSMISTETRKEVFGEDVYIDHDRKYVNPLDKKDKIHVPYKGIEDSETFVDLLYEKDDEQKHSPVFESHLDDINELPTEKVEIKEEIVEPIFEEVVEPIYEEIINKETKTEPQTYEPEFVSEVLEEDIIEELEEIEESAEEPIFKRPKQTRPKKVILPYIYPTPDMFSKVERNQDDQPEWLLNQRDAINSTLTEFNVPGIVENMIKGPTVTRHEIKLESGINVRTVTNIKDNLMMDLAATALRIEAPIPGKPYVGIEVPNEVPEIVAFGNVVDDPEFLNKKYPLRVALGTDIDGQNIYEDINKMPHGLVAGATNSGKSVCINTIIMSLLMKNHPDDLKFILIDPKMVELTIYDELPHLATPVITDSKVASTALNWAVEEMDRRFRMFLKARAKDLESYNIRAENDPELEKIPYLIIIIDELADLMMSSPADVEDSIQRITQKARAAGIHLIVATQRPTTDVVKGTIKANILTRIAFKVSSYVDSTVILDIVGAEQLLGRGDMLIKKDNRPVRLQGAYITDDEILKVTDFIRNQMEPQYLINFEDLKVFAEKREIDEIDDLLYAVTEYVITEGNASINAIQKEFAIGFNRAQKIVETLEALGYVGPQEGKKAREVYATEEVLREMNNET